MQGSGKILVVDDEPVQRDVTRQMLVQLGYTPFCVENGHAAVEFVKKQCVDLVVLDMIMEPSMNGRKTLEEILAICPQQKSLIVSGFAEDSEVKKACTIGHTTLLTKPYTITKLGEAVQRVLKD